MCEIKRIMHIPYEIVKTVHWHFGVFSSVKYLWRGIVLCALAGDCSSNTCHLFPHTHKHITYGNYTAELQCTECGIEINF